MHATGAQETHSPRIRGLCVFENVRYLRASDLIGRLLAFNLLLNFFFRSNLRVRLVVLVHDRILLGGSYFI